MADDETQGPEDTSWWGADAFSDSPLPAAGFDEPLVWPETRNWDPPPATGAAPPPEPPPPSGDHAGDMAAPVPVVDAEWRSGPDEGPVVDPGPLAALGGGTVAGPPAPTVEPPPPPDRLDELPTLGVTGLGAWPSWDDADGGDPPPASVQPDDAPAVADGNLLVTSTMAAPAVYASADANRGGGRHWPQVNVRPGNVAIVVLISVASLVLLGMFLSVRARNEVPTDASQTRAPSDGIAVTGTLNTVPLTTTVPTTQPPRAINLSDLIPALDTAGSTGGSEATGTGTATTIAATRSTTPSTAATTATTRPAPQTTTTTAAPDPEPSTASPGTASTPDDLRSTVTTRPPATTTSFTRPDIPDFSNSIPTLPQRRGIPGFSAGLPNDDDD